MTYSYISLFSRRVFKELFYCFQDHKNKLIKGKCYEEIRISDQVIS
jgi:hypothetical protein